MSASDAISPTAHYTGYVWARNGLSHPGLTTTEGRLLFDSLHPLMLISGALGGPSLERYLLARHRAIDALLERAIERDGSRRCWRSRPGCRPGAGASRSATATGSPTSRPTCRRWPPASASARADRLARRAPPGRDLDALRDDGPGSLAALAGELDRDAGLAIITEGLLGYSRDRRRRGLWRRVARALAGFPPGRYISDLHLGSAQTPEVRAFRVLLSAFVRGRVYLHFDDAPEAEAALRECGLSRQPRSRPATGDPRTGTGARSTTIAHILEASTE